MSNSKYSANGKIKEKVWGGTEKSTPKEWLIIQLFIIVASCLLAMSAEISESLPFGSYFVTFFYSISLSGCQMYTAYLLGTYISMCHIALKPGQWEHLLTRMLMLALIFASLITIWLTTCALTFGNYCSFPLSD